MKRNLKFNLTSILCFIAIMCAIFGMGLTVTNNMASANEQVTTFAMEAGVNVRPSRSDVPMTTEGRVATSELVQIPYPVVEASDIKAKFQDVMTSF